MKISFVTAILLYVGILQINAQQKMMLPNTNGRIAISNPGSSLQQSECAGTLNPKYITDDWNVVIKNFSPFNHTSSVPPAEFQKLKKTVNEKRINLKYTPNIIESRSATESPLIGKNFRGNMRGTGVPMDNSMAISRNGFIVSAINSNVIFTSPDGKISFTKGFPDFFKILGLGTRMYDPRVIYDVEQNKFIFMVLHGTEPANTFLCLAFSKTEDPNGEWNYYKVDGNPSGDDRWFDYPNIAISNQDFYIAGLMRDNPGDWQYSVLYQIDKYNGFDGKPLVWKYYNDLKDADGSPSFNLVPTPSGWDNLIGPGMYFVSNKPNGGNTYNLYYTSGSLSENPSIVSLQTTGTVTELAPDGRQKNTSNVLNTFDSRIWSALYLNGTIHLGSHVNTPNGDVGLFYGRMKVADLALHTDILTVNGRDYGFPSFSAFGAKSTDDDILVNYLVSGPDMYPGQEQRVCKGTTTFEWSDPVTLKEGVGFVNALSDDNERWGDYTTSCRRFFDGRTENWVTGCFGESASYGTWLGQFIRAEDDATTPMGEFTADVTTTSKYESINFNDLTTKNPTAWLWHFEGGVPATSTEKDPTITYQQNGAYNVTLIVTNDLGIDTIVKENYIHIQDPEVAPIADFVYERDTIYKDETVQFTNLSSENSVAYKWTFLNGTPPSSTDRDPIVKYSKLGSHLVSLTVSNVAGSHSKLVQKAVTVLNRTIPQAIFTSDKQNIMPNDLVQFSDISKGGTVSRKWIFEGGIPEHSNETNPIVTYPVNGKYDVTLIVKNELGTDSITSISYITVGTSAIQMDEQLSKWNLYPNPVQNDMLTVTFNNNLSNTFKIDITDLSGKIIKVLYDDKIKMGDNRLTFNTYNLASGHYLLNFTSQGYRYKTLKFSVVK